jgi:hypothetical protein
LTITERKAAILARIAEIQAAGDPAELQDMQDALNVLGVTDDG